MTDNFPAYCESQCESLCLSEWDCVSLYVVYVSECVSQFWRDWHCDSNSNSVMSLTLSEWKFDIVCLKVLRLYIWLCECIIGRLCRKSIDCLWGSRTLYLRKIVTEREFQRDTNVCLTKFDSVIECVSASLTLRHCVSERMTEHNSENMSVRPISVSFSSSSDKYTDSNTLNDSFSV